MLSMCAAAITGGQCRCPPVYPQGVRGAIPGRAYRRGFTVDEQRRCKARFFHRVVGACGGVLSLLGLNLRVVTALYERFSPCAANATASAKVKTSKFLKDCLVRVGPCAGAHLK